MTQCAARTVRTAAVAAAGAGADHAVGHSGAFNLVNSESVRAPLKA